MSKRLGQASFRELLPHSIAGDETIRRVADALDAPLAALDRTLPDLLVFSRLAMDSGLLSPVPLLPPLERLAALAGGLAELPEAAVDLLAWQLHVERYETAVSLAAKRAMVFSSIILHRKRGTPWAVKYGLETTLQVPAKISEWFEYGGDPYFFRVTLDVSGVAIDARAIENAVKIIFAHKNVRSWLEYLRTRTEIDMPVFIATGADDFTKTSAFSWRWLYRMPDLPAHLALCLTTSGKNTLAKWKFQQNEMRLRIWPSMTAASTGRFVLAIWRAPTPKAKSFYGQGARIFSRQISEMRFSGRFAGFSEKTGLAATIFTRSEICPR